MCTMMKGRHQAHKLFTGLLLHCYGLLLSRSCSCSGFHFPLPHLHPSSHTLVSKIGVIGQRRSTQATKLPQPKPSALVHGTTSLSRSADGEPRISFRGASIPLVARPRPRAAGSRTGQLLVSVGEKKVERGTKGEVETPRGGLFGGRRGGTRTG